MNSHTKKFKEYDHAFDRASIDACRKKYLLKIGNDDYVLNWRYGYNQPSIRLAKWAVYEADNFMDWQLFRVSMKGLSTSDKVMMLSTRWIEYACDYVQMCDVGICEKQGECATGVIEWVRIMNYIGALRRGGQLDAQNRIVK